MSGNDGELQGAINNAAKNLANQAMDLNGAAFRVANNAHNFNSDYHAASAMVSIEEIRSQLVKIEERSRFLVALLREVR